MEIPPCVRGRVVSMVVSGGRSGNTPVRTGKRGAVTLKQRVAGKYPRAYGEEPDLRVKDDQGKEIPPCVRGRGGARQQFRDHRGNTPVRTGKRSATWSPIRSSGKYPRAYGEEPLHMLCLVHSAEIPPCVRGRAGVADHPFVVIGNTPVRTGKSSDPHHIQKGPRKYPRAYGEECRRCSLGELLREIPPCVRGRDGRPGLRDGFHGNTPVRTGKRSISTWRSSRKRKYPRAYGEETN